MVGSGPYRRQEPADGHDRGPAPCGRRQPRPAVQPSTCGWWRAWSV